MQSDTADGDSRQIKYKRTAISKRVRFLVLQRDGFTCQYCGAQAPDTELQVDHIYPVAAGGVGHLDNLATSCGPCNAGKSARHLTAVPRTGAWIGQSIEADPLDLPECNFKRGVIPEWVRPEPAELTAEQFAICELVADAEARAFNRSLEVAALPQDETYDMQPDDDEEEYFAWLLTLTDEQRATFPKGVHRWH